MKKFETVTMAGIALLIGASLLTIPSSGCKKADAADGSAEANPQGEVLFSNCVACHGEDGLGKPDIEAPAIAGLGAWYVEGQLSKFQTGLRGKHPDDIAGLRMRPLSKTMRGEDEIKAVAAYVESLPPQTHPKTLQGDPGRGAALYAPCEACHGANGNGAQGLSAPRLNKMQDWYLLKQLKHFKSGVRGGAEGDTTGAQMASMVDSLENEQDMKDVVAYIMKLK
jgi:cytochrome c oxidase subunit 2